MHRVTKALAPLYPFVRVLLSLNVVLALGAASLVVATAVIGGQPIPWLAAAAAWASVFAVYNFDRLADRTPADGETSPRRRALLQRRARIVATALAAAAGFVVAVCLAMRGAYALWTLAFPIAGVAYVLPLLGGRRLKDIPYLKSVYVPACWCLFVAQAVAAGDGVWTTSTLAFAGFTFARIFVSAYLGDLRDLEQDATTGVRTLAVALGRERSVRFLYAWQALTAVAWLGVVALGGVPAAAVLLLVPSALAVVGFRVWLSRPADPELVLELYDFELVGFGVILLLAAGGSP